MLLYVTNHRITKSIQHYDIKHTHQIMALPFESREKYCVAEARKECLFLKNAVSEFIACIGGWGTLVYGGALGGWDGGLVTIG
jgi:hypothetical protein